MTTPLNDLLTEFNMLNVPEKDYAGYQRLHQLTKKIIKMDSDDVVPYFVIHLSKKKYLYEKGQHDIRLVHILKIFEHYQDPQCIAELIKLSEDKRASHYLKEICHCIGQFKTELSRIFLRKHLTNKPLAYLCAIALAYFPDPSGE